jgi:hypothetical protein
LQFAPRTAEQPAMKQHASADIQSEEDRVTHILFDGSVVDLSDDSSSEASCHLLALFLIES